MPNFCVILFIFIIDLFFDEQESFCSLYFLKKEGKNQEIFLRKKAPNGLFHGRCFLSFDKEKELGEKEKRDYDFSIIFFLMSAQTLYREGEDYQQISLDVLQQHLQKQAPLESFSYESRSPGAQTIRITSPELTCICPFSNLPDFGVVEIEYIPQVKCLELKSFKLFLHAFREIKIFHEAITEIIFEAFLIEISPQSARITVEMNPRGNVTTVCTKVFPEKKRDEKEKT